MFKSVEKNNLLFEKKIKASKSHYVTKFLNRTFYAFSENENQQIPLYKMATTLE